MLEINNKAPSFKLYNTEKKEISLDDQRGRNVVLLFFPLAFTNTCTRELCSIRDNYLQYRDLQATVFGISADSLYALGRYKGEQKLNFDLLSDWNKEASTAYQCIYPEFGNGMKGVPKRGAFVIDKEGILKYAEVLENASELPDFTKIQECLKTLN